MYRAKKDGTSTLNPLPDPFSTANHRRPGIAWLETSLGPLKALGIKGGYEEVLYIYGSSIEHQLAKDDWN